MILHIPLNHYVTHDSIQRCSCFQDVGCWPTLPHPNAGQTRRCYSWKWKTSKCVCGFCGRTLMERMVTAAMIQIILSLCIFNWNLILTFRYLSAHSEIILISADDHGCLLLNPRVPVQVSLSEINFFFSISLLPHMIGKHISVMLFSYIPFPLIFTFIYKTCMEFVNFSLLLNNI